MAELIKIRAINLSKQHPDKDADPVELLIEESYIRYRAKFEADEAGDDPAMPWEKVFNDIDIIILKKSISGIEKVWIDDQKIFKVSMLCKGFATDLSIYFKRMSEANDVYEKLLKYIL